MKVAFDGLYNFAARSDPPPGLRTDLLDDMLDLLEPAPAEFWVVADDEAGARRILFRLFGEKTSRSASVARDGDRLWKVTPSQGRPERSNG